MSKKRNLPKRVYLNKGFYYYVTLERKWIKLGKTESEMYMSLSSLASPRQGNMHTHFSSYLKEDTPKKATSTQKEERRIMLNLQKSFGNMQPRDVKPKHVYAYHRKRSEKAPAVADREKALLSSVFTKLCNLGFVDVNPCIGVRKNGSKPRQRYITDSEFAHFRERSSKAMQCALDLALITGLRMGDILKLTSDNIKDDGLHCMTSKTSRKIIFSWSDALLSVCDRCQHLHGKSSPYLVTNRFGQRFTSSGFQAQFQVLMRRLASNNEIERFQFRDIRTKAACDTNGNATRLLGHSSDSVTKRFYQVKPWVVKPN